MTKKATTSDKFLELQEFKDLVLSKSTFSLDELGKMMGVYIDSVKYFHFKNQMKGKEYDPDLDLKLKGVYEMYGSIKQIISDQDKKINKK